MNTLASKLDIEKLDLNAVRTFIAVVEHGGFRKAAIQLGQPKSTVSLRVTALEGALGQQLLRRTTRTVLLTEIGESFFQRSSEALATLADAVRIVKEAEASPRGVLKVTAPPAFAELFMDGMLSDFARTYPDVRLILDLSDRFVDLVAEGFDVALRAGPLPDSSLKARLLGSAPLHCYASPEYVRRKGAPQTPEELADHDILAFGTDDRATKWSFIVKKALRPFQLKPRMTLNSFVLLRQLAEAGLGIARMPAPLAGESVEQGRLVEVITRFALPPSPLHAVFVSSPHPSPKARAFLDHLSAHFASEPLPRRRPQTR